MVGAAQVDALLEVDGPAERLVESGIMRRDALHGGTGVAVAIGTGLVRGTNLALPQRFAVEHPEHAGVDGVVVLHCLGVRRHEAVAGAAFGRRNFGGAGGTRHQQRRGYGAGQPHSTVIEAEAVSEKPLSPIHSNSNLPLSVAVVKKLMNGLAGIPGKRPARKISAPL